MTSPYNADFDGDEMNMHIPQSIQAAKRIILFVYGSKTKLLVQQKHHQLLVWYKMFALAFKCLGKNADKNPDKLFDKDLLHNLLI